MAKNHRKKQFDIHEEEDIEQQVWSIALKLLKSYDPEKSTSTDPMKGLESWLNRSISSRLKNFYRDKFGARHKPRKGDTEYDQQKRVNLHHPLELDNVDLPDPVNSLEDREFYDFLIGEMEYQQIEVMYCCMSGENVGSYYKHRLQVEITRLREIWESHEDNLKS